MKRFLAFLWKEIYLIAAVAISIVAAAMFLPVFDYSMFSRFIVFCLTVATWIYVIVFRYDWEHVKSTVKWTTVAGKCVSSSSLETKVDTGIELNGVRVVIDIHQTRIDPFRLGGRWTVFHDDKSGVTLYRDETKIQNCWYYAY